MNRLTKRTTCGTANLAYPESCYFKSGAKDQIAVSAYRQQAIDRLAEYEDMEEQGLLVRLPCKVGDTIYRCGDPIKKIYEWQIAYVEVYDDETVFVDDSDNTFVEADIGKTVFLTREAAEKALEGNKESYL